MHYLTSTWDGKDEIYFLRPQDMHDMLQDILFETPLAFEYRASVIALLFAEKRYAEGIYDFPYDKWISFRNELVNPFSTMSTAYIREQLKMYNSNPTLHLHDIPQSSSYRFRLLLNRLWRTKEDFMAKKSKDEIHNEMLQQLWDRPTIAMTQNPYLYSALMEHCTQMKK